MQSVLLDRGALTLMPRVKSGDSGDQSVHDTPLSDGFTRCWYKTSPRLSAYENTRIKVQSGKEPLGLCCVARFTVYVEGIKTIGQVGLQSLELPPFLRYPQKRCLLRTFSTLVRGRPVPYVTPLATSARTRSALWNCVSERAPDTVVSSSRGMSTYVLP